MIPSRPVLSSPLCVILPSGLEYWPFHHVSHIMVLHVHIVHAGQAALVMLDFRNLLRVMAACSAHAWGMVPKLISKQWAWAWPVLTARFCMDAHEVRSFLHAQG